MAEDIPLHELNAYKGKFGETLLIWPRVIMSLFVIVYHVWGWIGGQWELELEGWLNIGYFLLLAVKSLLAYLEFCPVYNS